MLILKKRGEQGICELLHTLKGWPRPISKHFLSIFALMDQLKLNSYSSHSALQVVWCKSKNAIFSLQHHSLFFFCHVCRVKEGRKINHTMPITIFHIYFLTGGCIYKHVKLYFLYFMISSIHNWFLLTSIWFYQGGVWYLGYVRYGF